MAAQATICAAAPVVSIAKATPTKAARPAILAPAVNQWAKKTVSNGIKTSAMQVWTPTNNKYGLCELRFAFSSLGLIVGFLAVFSS